MHADAVAELEALAARFTWESTGDWLQEQPPWLQRAILERDPNDLGVNLDQFVAGLERTVADHDRRGQVLAQLAVLRSLELAPDSAMFERLRNEVDALGDPYIDALLRIVYVRSHIAMESAPEDVVHHLAELVSAAEQLCDRHIDEPVSDAVGTYGAILGASSAARAAFEFSFRSDAPGSLGWVRGHLNLAAVEISEGSLAAARRRYLLLGPYVASMPSTLQNFAEWIRILSEPHIAAMDRAQLSEIEALSVRKRAIRRYQLSDLTGIVPVEGCIEEILAGVPTDPVTGLVLLPELRAMLDETVAIDRTAQLVSIGLAGLLRAADQLGADDARRLVDLVVERFGAAHRAGLLVARVDLDRYAVLSTLDATAFNHALDELLSELRAPISVADGPPLRLEPIVRATSSESGDTGYGVWERVFSSPPKRVAGSEQVPVPKSTESELRYRLVQALTNDNAASYAKVEFQPIVDVRAQAVVGFEALLRWESPELGQVSPLLVVKTAEQCGAISQLERAIVTASVHGAGELRSVDPSCRVNINVTASQLADTSLVEHLIAECDRNGVPAASIGIELTESALINHDLSVPALDLLAERGFGTTLDDFGTGYSNLAYLVQMRNVGLKIDGSFVRHMLDDERSAAVCRMLIGAADTLDMSVIAEQVETDAQAARLDALGCATHQGFRYAASMSLESAKAALANPAGAWSWPALPTTSGLQG